MTFRSLHHKVNQTSASPRKHKNPLVKASIVAAWVVGILFLVFIGLLWGFTLYFSPEHIIRLVEEKCDEYLEADVKISRIDYKLFSTYPWLYFEVDSIEIVSRSLQNLSAEEQNLLPENADFLSSVDKISGKINLYDLLRKKVNLKNIDVEKPKVNIVVVNDSVSNFNILKTKPSDTKMPDLQLSEIKVGAPVDFSFFSLPDDMEGQIDVESFDVIKNPDNIFNLSFEGTAKGRYQDYELEKPVPLKFSSEIKPYDKDKDFDVTINNLSIGLAGILLNVSGEINAGKNGIDMKKAHVSADIEDVFALIEVLPGKLREMIPLPEGLTGVLPVDMEMEMTSPLYLPIPLPALFSQEKLPSLYAVVRVNDAALQFTPPKEKAVEADDIYLELIANFSPKSSENTRIDIRELRLNGEGIALNANLQASNLTGENQDFSGKLTLHSPLMQTLSYLVPDSPVKIGGVINGEMEFSGTALELGKKGLSDLKLNGDITSSSLKMTGKTTGTTNIRNLKTKFKGTIPSYPLSDYAGTGMDMTISADSVWASQYGTNVRLGRFFFELEALDTVSGNPDPYGNLKIKARALQASSGQTVFRANNIDLKANGALNPAGAGSYNAPSYTASSEDALIAQRVKHTPLTVEYTGGGIIQTLMTMLNINADLKIAKGVLKSPVYLFPVEFKGMETQTNLNHLKLTAKEIKLGRTGLTLYTDINGLMPFMTSYSATPIKVSADINFSEVDINQLAWGYYGALIQSGKDSVWYIPPVKPYTAADSLCVAIPRNIQADIRLFSNAARYMQYDFFPLSTDIIVNNGVATLSKLSIGTPYCTAVVDWTYSTANLADIFMNLDAKVVNFKFLPFYKVFPKLMAKAPELQNLTGDVNALINCRFDMFPNMFMNSESLKGNFDIKAGDLLFERKGKIERITHLMLIEGDQPIKIQNIDITGAYHSNLLQINPFKINFDDYQLEFAGINNTAGDMYYHLALEKSPFHLPFGVSLTGNFKHPEVRLGGTRINDFNSEKVSMDPASKIDVNIMAWLKNGWTLFIQEAAKFEQKSIEKK